MNKIVTGILAHVDSGKTTLSEAILYKSGVIRNPGRVDHGNSYMDTSAVERERGITVFSNSAAFKCGEKEITLLDTPGHVDFSAETERTLCVLDYAILVISAPDGVQSHTRTLWRLLSEYSVPTFIFINKTDLSHRGRNEIISELKKKLSSGCTDMKSEADEDIAMCDERLTEAFIKNDSLTDEDISGAVKRRNIFPCVFGSALKGEGIDEIFELFEKYAVAPPKKDSFSARVYKITTGEQGERLTHMKITGGTLSVKDNIEISGKSEKVNGIRIYSGSKYEAVKSASQGTVCAVSGLAGTFAGQGLGSEKRIFAPICEPVLCYRAVLTPQTDTNEMLRKLRTLSDEDPQLDISWNNQTEEITFKIMGEVQLEILKRIISERFGESIEFEQAGIAYKETIKKSAEGVGHYEPLRHYAEVHLLLEPLPRGSGLIFKADCSEDMLDKNWQRLILTHLAEKTHFGTLIGAPITDMKITLISGRAHIKHTVGGDFRQATYRALRQGLMQAECVLLEPYYSYYLEIPTECVGRAMTDLENMGADFSQPEANGDFSLLSGSVPAAKIIGYQSELIGYTKGRGQLSCSFNGYDICHNGEEIAESFGYDPTRDIENTPDSVFCAHGAGFTVKWNEVYKYQHIENRKEKNEEQPQQRISSYISSIADDKELMRIFEQTYGKVNISAHKAFKTRKQPQHNPKPQKPQIKADGKDYLLVDGYNIIFAWDRLKKLSEKSLDLAREALINTMCNYQGFKKCEVIVVFDAYRVSGAEREIEKYRNINIVYTKEAETADMYIEKTTHELGRKHRVRVATSDNLEQLIILAGGALRVSAEQLREEVDEADRQIREYIKNLKYKE